MPYSWACETPVSDFETRMDNSYREKVSKAITVTFTLKEKPKAAPEGFANYKLMVWTTTPWTLPSNLAIAVGKDVEYSFIEKDDNCLIIASSLASSYEKEIGNNVVGKIKGADLAGLTYEPLFPYFKDCKNAFRVFTADFVTIEDGTGIVHMAPGFGEDDQKLCEEYRIEIVCPVDNAGKFTSLVKDYKGLQVFEADDQIIKRLKAEGKWIKTEQYIHNYPHCWRTDTPLIYKAVPSWYVKVTAFKDRMIKNNQQINWMPSHIKDGLFGKWLENARDWSISRNRYWGCPIPVWQSDDPDYPHMEVYGSIKEMEEAFNVKIEDLHRPYIDTLVKPNPKDPTGKSMMRRVPEVLDCWFESGSMPYAQVHYPFENKEWFEGHFPADFIVEYVAQTRGWFYTLVVLSTALFDKPPFLNCICHGVLLGDGGQKLSKRLKNYADPNHVFDTLGADAMRWFMISSPVMRGQELIIDKDAKGIKEALRSSIKPIWNAYNFFTLYANADGIKAKFDLSSKRLLDRYILSKCAIMVDTIKDSMDKYDTVTACKAIESFVEILNNWYIRRSRERFWKSEKDQDKTDAYNTLYSALTILCKAAAPLLPLSMEEIYLNLVDNAQSIHLELFPEINYPTDTQLVTQMDRVMDACSAALSIRNDTGIRVRQPLASVTFIGVSKRSITEEEVGLILDEINVKEWKDLGKDKLSEYANYKLQIKFPMVGKRIPHKVKDIIAAQKAGQWNVDEQGLYIAGENLVRDEYELLLEPKSEYKGSIAPLSTHDALVLLDLNITEDLKLEGIRNDIVRDIQQARKGAELAITDKINITLYSDDNKIKEAIENGKDYIKEQTLTAEIRWSIPKYDYTQEVEIEGKKLQVSLQKC
jgi:isoleucyl-tRNA synthetase